MKHFTKLLMLTFLLNGLYGCAKTATETAADAALQQVDVIEQQIKKDCPTVNYDKKMESLRASIKSQLATCELQRAKVESDKVKWQVAFFGLLLAIGVWFSRKLV